jgi:DNA polymerase III alpha subunit
MHKTQALALMSFISLGNNGFFQESSTEVVVMGFIHLHVHSQYSFLDGASSLDNLLSTACELKMPAMALTDHNCLTGAVRFYEKAKRSGIKPIIGAEINFDRKSHLTLLCKDGEGYSNLCRLLTEAHLSNRRQAPFVSKESLSKFSGGLVVLSGCYKGELSSLIMNGRIEEARIASRYYRELFGNDFYIELPRYPCREGMSSSYALANFAKEINTPVVATNNVHYCKAGEYKIKELLNAIDRNIPVSQLGGYRTV